jgi:preprotein translocase subunit SecG
MVAALLVIHVLIALALIGTVLLQRSEGGALGSLGGGAGGGMTGFMTARGSANLLTRATAILAALFFATSVFLTMRIGSDHQPHSIVDQLTAPSAPSAPAPAEPAAPPQPSVPLR